MLIEQGRRTSPIESLAGATASINGSAGLYVKDTWANMRLGSTYQTWRPVADSSLLHCRLYSLVGPTPLVSQENGAPRARSETSGVSYAYAFSDKTFSFGVTEKLFRRRLQGEHDTHRRNRRQRRTNLGTHALTPGIDVGAIAHPHGYALALWLKTSINRPLMLPRRRIETGAPGSRRSSGQPLFFADVDGRCRCDLEQDVCSRRQEPGVEFRSRTDHLL